MQPHACGGWSWGAYEFVHGLLPYTLIGFVEAHHVQTDRLRPLYKYGIVLADFCYGLAEITDQAKLAVLTHGTLDDFNERSARH
jgi:hypothetical protein